jgi:hypothetical protein
LELNWLTSINFLTFAGLWVIFAHHMKPLTSKDLVRLATLAGSSEYNEARKKEFQLLGGRTLKELAFRIGLKPEEYDIRWNPGGIAVSGDHILHTDKLYVALHDNCGTGWFYWRTCQGKKDYSGGPNQIVHWNHLATSGLQPLADSLKKIQYGLKESH